MAEEKIKFPFEPNEKVKAAFRNEAAIKHATRLITEALVETVAKCITTSWEMLRKEHPELLEILKPITYNHFTQTVDLSTK